MSDERRPRALSALRNLVLAAERRAAKEAASAAVSGAADELRERLPDFDGQLERLAEEVFAALSRVLQEVAQPGTGTRTAHQLSVAVTRGALDELERQWREGGLPLHGFFQRVNHLLDQAQAFVANKAEVLAHPEDQAYAIAVSALQGISDELHDSFPRIVEDTRAFAPVAADAAGQVGGAFFSAVAQQARAEAGAFDPLLENAGRAFARGMAAGAADELEDRLRKLGPWLRRVRNAAAAGVAAIAAGALLTARLRHR